MLKTIRSTIRHLLGFSDRDGAKATGPRVINSEPERRQAREPPKERPWLPRGQATASERASREDEHVGDVYEVEMLALAPREFHAPESEPRKRDAKHDQEVQRIEQADMPELADELLPRSAQRKQARAAEVEHEYEIGIDVF